MKIFETITSRAIDGIVYECLKVQSGIGSSRAHIITYNKTLSHLKMIVSKASEALNSNIKDNHIGEGGTLHSIFHSQPDSRFAINGTFNHYRKNFYNWGHQDFNVGDPVGIAKIRHHAFKDVRYDTLNGFLQFHDDNWTISDTINDDSKYILSSRPLLIHNSIAPDIPLVETIEDNDKPVIPPSFLGHAFEYHPRTAVGMRNDEIVFIVVEGEGVNDSTGFILRELQEFGVMLNLESLLNLDGGGSSRFILKGKDAVLISNDVEPEDENRILGHALMIFSENLPSHYTSK